MTKLNLLKTLCAALLLTLAVHTSAQIEVDKRHTYDIYGVLKKTNNHLYTFNQVNKTFDKKELIIYDLSGEKLNRIELQSRVGYDLIQGLTVGDGSLFCLRMKTMLLMIQVDADGNETFRKEFEYGKFSDVKLYAYDNGFFLTSEVKVKKVGTGVRIERLDGEFNSQWTFDHIPEKGKHFHRLTAMAPDGKVSFVYEIGNSEKYKAITVNTSGEMMSDVEFNNNSLSDVEPYRAYYSGTNELTIIADAGATNNTVFMKMATTLLVNTIDVASGTETSSQKLSFKAVQEEVGDKREDGGLVYPEAPALRVVDVQKINGQNTFICESYLMKERSESVRATSSSTTATVVSFKQIAMMDLYLLNASNLSAGIRRIWKPKRTLEMDGLTYTTSVRYCNLLEENNLFSYQFIQNDNIVVRGFSQNYEYINWIPVGASHDGVLTRKYWGEPISNKRGTSNFTQTFRTSSVGNKPNINRDGLLQLSDGFILYHYDGITNELELSFNKN